MFIQTLARLLAHKFNLSIQYANVPTFAIGKKTDGSLVLYLSRTVLEVADESADNLGVVLRGALAHEALGHGYHTDFDAPAAQEGAYAKSLANFMEDVRIESLAPKRFPGARRILADMVEELQRSHGFWIPKGETTWQQDLMVGMLRYFRASILGQPFDAAVTDAMLDRVRSAIGKKLVDAVMAEAGNGCVSGSTAEVNACADRIVKMLSAAQSTQSTDVERSSPDGDDGDARPGERSDAPEDRGRDEDSDSGHGPSDPGDAEDRDPDASGRTTPSSGEENEQDPATSSDGGESDETTDETSTQGEPNAGGDDTDEPMDGDNVASRTPADAGGDGESDMGESDSGFEPRRSSADDTPAGSESGSISEFDPSAEVAIDVESAVNEIVSSVSGRLAGTALNTSSTVDIGNISPWQPQGPFPVVIQRMRRRLDQALMAVTDDIDDEPCDMGRLDMNRLPATVLGFNDRPFLDEKSPGEALDTELMVLFDASSSMYNLGPAFLRSLVYGTAIALMRYAPDLGLSFATFNGGAQLIHRPGVRVTPHRASLIAGFYSPNGSTVWSNSAAYLVPELAMSHRRRRILLTVTDGEVETSGVMSAVLADAARHRIECPFVTIGHRVPDGCEGIQCDTKPEAFAEAFCDVLTDRLIRQHARN